MVGRRSLRDKLKGISWPVESIKKNSITRRLIISLTLIIVTVSLAAITASYIVSNQMVKAEIESEAEEKIISLTHMLEMPLWDYDQNNVEQIAWAHMEGILVTKLSVVDSGGTVLFSEGEERKGFTVTRTSRIFHEGREIGYVEITLAQGYLMGMTRQFLSSAGLIILINLVCLATAIIFLMPRYFRRPIEQVTEIANHYGSGEYDVPEKQDPPLEFRPIIFVLNSMAENIRSQMMTLRKNEERLTEYSERLEDMVEERTRELKDAQEELIRSEQLATLGQFSGSISHELRNPLGVIDSSVYYLRTRLQDADEKVQGHLSHIKSSVNRSTAIIESLLNLTRMKEPHVEKLDLVAVILDAISTSKVPNTVKVIENFADQEILVKADREQLRMAFKNIIENAIEAMEGTGTLTVTVHSTADGQAELSFADTGPGIAPENLEKVFQPLFSTKAKGIGFGLSISQMIVEKHGGAIAAESVPGKRAVIVIRLPLPADEGVEL